MELWLGALSSLSYDDALAMNGLPCDLPLDFHLNILTTKCDSCTQQAGCFADTGLCPYNADKKQPDIFELLQLKCILRDHGLSKLAAYLLDHSKECLTDYQGFCADGVKLSHGFDLTQLRECADSKLYELQSDHERAEYMQVSRDATVLVNGELYAGWLSADGLAEYMCHAYSDLA